MTRDELLSALFDLLEQLDVRHARYSMSKSRDDQTIMVLVFATGQYWEVEFLFDEGRIDIERFVSDGEISDETVLKELWARFEGWDKSAFEVITGQQTTE